MTNYLTLFVLSLWIAWSFISIGPEQVELAGKDRITFESDQVAYLYGHYDLGKATPLDSIRVPGASTSSIILYSAPQGVPGLLAAQVKDGKHIQHVGLHLFSGEESVAFEGVGQFIERFLLQVYARALSPEMSLSLLKSQRITVRINGYTLGGSEDVSNDVRILPEYLMKERSCTLDWRAYTYFFTCETDNYDLIELQIPAHAELVLGLDKKELQEALGRNLEQGDIPGESSVLCTTVPASSSLDPHRTGILRTQGRILHPGIRSEIYFQKEKRGHSIELLRDESDWLEYLNNMIVCPPSDLSAQVRVEHKMYGVESASWEMSLSGLLRYFDANSFQTYVGFERDEDLHITGTAVFKHKSLNYNHLLVIHNLDHVLSTRHEIPVLKADLYTFIRSGNIGSLFGDYVDREGEKIQVSIDP